VTTSRDRILGRIGAALEALPARTPHPDYDPALPVSRTGRKALEATDPTSVFNDQLRLAGGRPAADWADLAGLLRAGPPGHGYCAPAFADSLRAAWPDAPIETTFDRARIDTYDFAVTPAWGAIAETGTIILTDQVFRHRLAALAPWTHAAIVPRTRVFPTLVDAIRHLPRDPSIILVTGPSKTADIEGILIEGVHGPGIQIALIDESPHP